MEELTNSCKITVRKLPPTVTRK